MKIYLASFMEPDNFGPGRLIGICHGQKPFKINVEWKYPQLTPKLEHIEEYKQNKESDYKSARMKFIRSYDLQLKIFCEEVEEDAKNQGKSPQDLLPFQDGDTLCSWERAERTHYRNIVGGWLEYLGYDVNYA